MKTPDLDRIRYVTRNLGDLQDGVKSGLSLGLFILFGGLALYSGRALWLLLQLASLVGFVFMRSRGQRYLEARFGRVEQKKWWAPERVRDTILGGGLLLVGLAGYFLTPSASAAFFSFDRLLYLFVGAMFLFRWIFRQHRLAEAYNLGIAALFLVIGTRGAIPGLTPPAWRFNHPGQWNILFGSAMILTGLVDYWQLARTLPQIAEESEALVASASE